MRPTLQRVGEVFRIDAARGRVYWRIGPKFHPEVAGKEAGCARPNRNRKLYWVIKLDGIALRRSRLIFFAVNGRWPEPCVDHANGKSTCLRSRWACE